MEKEKSDNSGMFQGKAEKKPASNMLSNGTKPVMGASSWPSLSETAPCSNKSSSGSFKSIGYDGSSSSVSFSSQLMLQRMEQTLEEPDQKPSSAYPLPYTSIRGHNQHKWNSNKNQNVTHQCRGGRYNEEYVNQNWNPHRNFNGLGGFSQSPRGGTPGVVRPSPPPPPPLVPLFYAHHMSIQQLFYPMLFTELAPPMMHHPPRMPFIEPPPVLVPSQETPLETKILNQVQYYLSEDNLPNDVYLRKRMNDEGFVHVEFIAGFNKLKALTSNIQLVLDSLQGSDIVEVQGYEIRNRHVWRKYVMPHDLRVPFYPSPEYNMQWLTTCSSSRNQNMGDQVQAIKKTNNNNNSVGYHLQIKAEGVFFGVLVELCEAITIWHR